MIRDQSFDYIYYKTYLADLEHSLAFKRDLLEKEIIKQTDITKFDNSVYDCYRAAFKND